MIHNLIICGGGVKIMSYLGAVSFLNDNNILQNIKSFFGVSAGGILCVMLSIGYSIDEIKNFLFKFDFTQIVRDINPSIIFDTNGLSYGRNIEIIAKSVITYKIGEENLNYSFNQLYNDKGIKLVLCAYNITSNKPIYFDYTFDTPIWKALVASCRIPIIFTPFEIDNCQYIDGGICDNFPIHLIPDNEIKNTIGIFSQILNNNIQYFDYTILNYFLNLINIMFSSCYSKLKIKYEHIIIDIPSTFSFIDFDLSQSQKDEMFNSGYSIAKETLPNILQFCQSKSNHKDTQTD